MVFPVAIPAIAAAAASVAGGIFGNESAKSESRRNRRWQERMSNTAFQRSVKDMRLAGINPMLAAKMGGASTPAGGQANIQNAAKGVAQDYSAVSQNKAAVANLNEDTKLKVQKQITEQTVQRMNQASAKGGEQMNNAREPFSKIITKSGVSKTIDKLPSFGQKMEQKVYDAMHPSRTTLAKRRKQKRNQKTRKTNRSKRARNY